MIGHSVTTVKQIIFKLISVVFNGREIAKFDSPVDWKFAFSILHVIMLLALYQFLRLVDKIYLKANYSDKWKLVKKRGSNCLVFYSRILCL